MFKLAVINLADCINTIFFGEICDNCDGSAILAILALIIQILTGLIVVVATLGIIIVGITYQTSSGNIEKQVKAKHRLYNIIIGLAFYAVGFAFLNFLLPGGVIGHEISSSETSSCPEKPNPQDNPSDEHSDTDSTSQDSNNKSSFTVATAKYNGKEYQYIEINNKIPYVYYPNNPTNFKTNLSKIESNTSGGNILIIANAGEFNTKSYAPVGVTIANGQIITSAKASHPILVVDENGNFGYAAKSSKASALLNGTASYIDGRTGKTITGKKIVSAVTGFGPIVINNKVAYEFENEKSHYKDRRARQIFCTKENGTYVIITNEKEGSSGGWNFDDMANASIERGCIFAYNLDGGGSTATATRKTTADAFSVYTSTGRKDPTYIVFTADNKFPNR